MTARRTVTLGPGDAYAVPMFGQAALAAQSLFAGDVGSAPAAHQPVDVGCAACGSTKCTGGCGAEALELAVERCRCGAPVGPVWPGGRYAAKCDVCYAAGTTSAGRNENRLQETDRERIRQALTMAMAFWSKAHDAAGILALVRVATHAISGSAEDLRDSEMAEVHANGHRGSGRARRHARRVGSAFPGGGGARGVIPAPRKAKRHANIKLCASREGRTGRLDRAHSLAAPGRQGARRVDFGGMERHRARVDTGSTRRSAQLGPCGQGGAVMADQFDLDAAWSPQFSPWRHGGWYVDNVRYPSGAVGCVSRNYPDAQWRVVCANVQVTFPSREAAARAEYLLAETERRANPPTIAAMFELVAAVREALAGNGDLISAAFALIDAIGPANPGREEDQMARFTLDIATDNAAFEDDPGEELARILRRLSDHARAGNITYNDGGKVRDTNGNTVGSWSLVGP